MEEVGHRLSLKNGFGKRIKRAGDNLSIFIGYGNWATREDKSYRLTSNQAVNFDIRQFYIFPYVLPDVSPKPVGAP